MIWVWLWIGGVIAFSVPTARFILNDMGDASEPDSFDYVMASITGVLAACFWPCYIPGYYVYWMLKRGQRH